jgi:O-antigen/teichoic acid export membrane protein
MNVEIAKSVAKNTAVQMGQQIITWISSFLLMLFLPRYLGPVNYGQVYLAMSIAGIFLMFIDFDGRLGIAKRISRLKEATPQILVNAIGMRIIFWIIAFSAMIIFTYIAGYPSATRALLLIFGLEMLWIGVRTVFLGTFLGFELMQYASIGAIIERLFISLVGVSAVLLGVSTMGIAIIMVTGTFINFLICIKFMRRIVTHLPSFQWSGALLLIKEGIPYLLWTIFGAIYYRIDTVMLSLLTPAAVVGWYGASYKFFDMLAFLPSIYTLSILPVMSRMWGKEDGMLALTTQKSLEFIMLAGIPMSIAVFSFSEPIIKLFFGLEGYGPSVLNLQIFGAGLLLIYIDMVLGTTLFACDKQRQWAIVAFFAVIVNVSLNYFTIPYTQTHWGNGGIGAALATILTEFFVMVSAITILPKKVFDASIGFVTLRAFVAGCVMAIAIWSVHRSDVAWVFQATIGFIVYVVTLFALKTFKPQEIAFMKNFLSLQNLKNAFAFTKGTSA